MLQLRDDAYASAVFTACGRPDLLAQTLRSFVATVDAPLREVIVVEDSGRDCNAHLVAEFPQVTWVTHPRNLGQVCSVDAAYARVTAPFVFHCEDDWEFLRGGYIGASRRILDAHPDVFTVVLRGHGRPYYQGETREDGTVLTSPWTVSDYAHSYTFNPGLRRMEDYRAHGPYAKLATFVRGCAWESEWDLAVYHQKAGFRLAHAAPEAYVAHAGDGRHVGTRTLVERCSARPPRGRTTAQMRTAGVYDTSVAGYIAIVGLVLVAAALAATWWRRASSRRR